MLSVEEIKNFIQDDASSDKKRFARKGQAWHTTIGKHPHRALNNAFTTLKSALKARLEQILKGM